MKPLIIRFDTKLSPAVQNVPAIKGLMNCVTFLGDPIIVIAIGLSAVIYGWQSDNPVDAAAFGYATIVYIVGSLLKEFIRRTRPDTRYVTNMKFKTYSFPSAHALGSMLIYGILSILANRQMSSPWDTVVPVSAATLIFLIGMSRVYLGAHYPSDVIGGWLMGGLSLILIFKYVVQ